MRPCEGRGGGFNSPRTPWLLTAPCLADSSAGPPKAGWPVRLWRGVMQVVSRIERWVYETRLAGSTPARPTQPGPRQGIGALNLGRVGSTPTLAIDGRRRSTGRAPPS